MKYFSIIVLVLCTFFVSVTQASPGRQVSPRQYSGLYIGVMAGANMTALKSGQRSPVFKVYQQNSGNDTRLNGDLALGFKFGHMRFALETALNQKAHIKDYYYHNKTMHSLQFYYEVPMSRRVMPFVNLGLGKYKSVIKASPGIEGRISGTALDIGGGLTFVFNRRISTDLGYRYVRLGNKKFQDSENADVSLKACQHLLYMGFRYTF